MGRRFTYIPNRVIDTNGISDGASIYVYQTGTTTPVSLYSDESLTTPIANPYVVPAGAAVPEIYHDHSGNIRVRVVQSGGEVVSDDDPYQAPVSDIELASIEGAGKVGLPQGGTMADAIRYVTPQMFGAVGDWDGSTGTDDTDAFQAAIDAAESLGWGLNIPHSQYRITGPLVIDEAITIYSDGGHLLYDSNEAGVALTVSRGTSGNLLSRPRVLGHLVLEKVTADWSVDCHGVKLENLYMGEFHLSVLKFNRGIWLHSNETGCVYNDIYVSQLTNNKYSTYLSTETATGWTNQNTFWGGRYSNGINEAGSHIFIDDSLYDINGNCWLRPSLEASGASFELFNLQGAQNSILHPRCEHGAGPTYYGELGGTKNEIEAHSSPYLTEARVNITGTLCRLVTSVGSRSRQQESYTFERQGAGPVLAVRNVSGSGGIEVQTSAGARAVHITANEAWEVFNGKKVLWRSTAAPSTGTWSRGDISWVTNPSSGGPVGYVCVTAGTPGTWAAFGIAGASRATTVSDPAGGTTIDTECRAQLAALIDALQTAGLMA